jgi:hypothetical protein
MNHLRIVLLLFILFYTSSLFSSPLPKLIPYKKGAKWGYADSTKKIIVPCRFTSVDPLRNGYAAVYSSDNKFGFIDSTGKIYHEAEFDYDHHRSIGVFEGNFMRAQKNGKCGLINKKGNWTVQPLYDYLDIQEPNKIYASLGKTAGYIDTTGKIIFPFLYDYVYEETTGFYVVRKNEKYGLADKKNKIIIPVKYDQVGYAGEGIFFVSKDSVPGKPYPKYSGFVDSTGKDICPVIFRYHGKFSSGLAPVSSGRKWGFVDRNGKIVIDTIYDHVSNFSCNRACVTRDGKYGYIDLSGKLITEIKYSTWNVKLNPGQPFKNNFAIVEMNGKPGMIDTAGKEILPCGEYSGIWWQEEYGFYILNRGAYSDASRKIFYPNGQLINSMDCRDPVLFRGGPRLVALSAHDSVFFYQALNGDTLNNRIYHFGSNSIPTWYLGFHEGLGLIIENSNVGFIDVTGKTVVPCKYYKVTSFENGIAFVRTVTKDEKGISHENFKGYIDRYGTEYWED